MELVDRAKLLAEFENNHWEDGDPKYIAIQILLSAQTVETAPVVRGKWVDYMPILGAGDKQARCSECGLTPGEKTPYCAFCGAKME